MADHVVREVTSLSAGDSPNSSNQTSTPSQTAEALKDLTCGSIAGAIGKVIEYPFDTVKVRLQSQPSTPVLTYAGPIDCFRKSIRNDGFMSLYRGVSAPLFGAAVETSSLFFSYRIAKDAVKATFYKDSPKDEALPLNVLALCGAASGAFTSLLLTPIELVKCQMQVPLSPSKPTGPGPLSIIASIFRHQGVFGFWHGQIGTLIRETGGSAAWFGGKEGVSMLFEKWNSSSSTKASGITSSRNLSGQPLPLWQQLVAGAAAGMSYNFIFFPADTIKSRMQTEQVEVKNHAGKQTFWSTGKTLWQEQGLKGMYRGCGITVARSAPSSALMFTVYEGLIRWWG